MLAFLLALIVSGVVVRGLDVPEYFPGVSDDLGKVTWAHAVNSKALIEEALNGEVMMLEADVVLGRVFPGHDDAVLVPIMAHPPAIISDLSLQEFLARVVIATTVEGKRKGIKLDFKSLAVLEPALQELESISSTISFPVWLNADILRGPVESQGTPVEATSFLSQCKERFPGSTLSTGWTTRFGEQNDGSNITTGSYSPAQIDEMTRILMRAELSQPITFPVRAGIAAHSGTEIITLLAGTPNSTLTLWGSESDPVDVEALKDVLNLVGSDKVYIDVPEALREALRPSGAAAAVIATPLVILSTLAGFR